ncbi:glycosyltransferase family protein [Halapricum hydrolyticum]|uniref:Glycosyl transferase family 2 n=1 Tax=Halapricum hydrolyticum TaxID=2979991 RepID=A0AAE3IAV2_9EURY|nr:glycosyl transferase family 2 [Halapricum hydrolyticum]MCU4717548.1 glycosyl transferase family 2 [Halapricum hydrolyticum]MCU4726712.1 glycosyl transferase family 2 [Halapricum hydrolyticum]
MEYVQERVTTLHDFGGADPDAPTDRATVVVPMTERDHASLAAERVFSTLEAVSPGRVLVALRAGPDRVSEVHAWLETFDLPLVILWCDSPPLTEALAAADLNGRRGKGRDVWLALGVAAADSEFVVVHDADAKSYAPTHVPRLLFPLAHGFAFSKGYYARVENDHLYGRLNRLFYVPLVRALEDAHDAPILSYLAAFRYALAGEFAMTADLARRVRVPRTWGLEVGTLGGAFEDAGFEDTAQVDLGQHEHDHRSVSGPDGLGEMCQSVGRALWWVLEDAGVEPDFETLPDRYRERAATLIEQYAADAAFNGLAYDRSDEREQVTAYAETITPPDDDTRLPAWTDAPISPETVRERSREGLDAID